MVWRQGEDIITIDTTITTLSIGVRKDLADIGVVIPAYDAEKTISNVIEELINFGFKRGNIIVVDDGSMDNTYRVSKKYNIEVAKHPKNRGKGAAQKTGFGIALEKRLPYILTLDADGQHRIEEVANLIEGAKDSDVVIGNRMGNLRSMPLLNRLSNRTTSLIVSLFIRKRLRDSQCGFRLIKAELLRDVSLRTSHYQTESELLIKAGERGYKISEVKITTLYPESISFIHPLLDTLRFITLVLKSFWR